MSPAVAQRLLNGALPGAGLVLRGRFAIGVPLLLAALFAATVALMARLVATPGFAGQVALVAVAIYAVLAVLASAMLWWLDRRPPWDEERIRALHREASRHYLCDELGEALLAAEQLVRAAPGEPGAWRLLLLLAEARGDAPLVERARRRLGRLLADAGDG